MNKGLRSQDKRWIPWLHSHFLPYELVSYLSTWEKEPRCLASCDFVLLPCSSNFSILLILSTMYLQLCILVLTFIIVILRLSLLYSLGSSEFLWFPGRTLSIPLLCLSPKLPALGLRSSSDTPFKSCWSRCIVSLALLYLILAFLRFKLPLLTLTV